jgi:hypothetical protein
MRSVGLFVGSASLGAAIPLSAFYLISISSGILPPSQPWFVQHPDLYIEAFDFLPWLVPFVLCAILIRWYAGAQAIGYGDVAAFFGVVALLALLAEGAASRQQSITELVRLFGSKFAILAVVLPLLCALRLKRNA